MSENKNKFTPLSELGEFLLIDKLVENNKTTQKTTVKSVGDDAAVVRYENSEAVLLSNDLLVEGIHFDLTYTPLKYLGFKAVSENVSDIYAMNAKPEQIVVSFAVSSRFTYEALDELYKGIYEACDFYGVDLVGGDVTSSRQGLFLSISVLGHSLPDKIVYRNGAKYGDLVCVTGDLGAAYLGLQVLIREKKVAVETKTTPDWTGYEYVLQRQLKPVARKDIFEFFEQNKIVPNAMIDISDGLSSEIIHICKQSNVGALIYEKYLPYHEQTAKVADEMDLPVTTPVMNGGEDYELLFTVPQSLKPMIEAHKDIHIIGNIIDKPHKIDLVAKDGTEIPILAQGWNSFEN